MTTTMITEERWPAAFDAFSCVGFERGCVGHGAPNERWPNGVPLFGLHATGAYRGATEAWDYFRRDPRKVWGDIEHRGDDWHVDIITNAYGAGRYDGWFSARYPTLESAWAALQWLTQDDWAVLRSKVPERNTARRLTNAEYNAMALAIGAYPL